MNKLVDEKILYELPSGNNLTYILNDENKFSPTEYKVLHSFENGCLVKCMKLLYNGKVQFFYMTDGYKPLSKMLATVDADAFIAISINIFRGILEIKKNGFLSCAKIETSFEHIYVDTNTYKVYLVYFPINHIFEDEAIFEYDLRANLSKLIIGLHQLSTPKTMQFLADLQNGMLSTEDLLRNIQSVDEQHVKNVLREEKKAEKIEKVEKTYYSVKMIALNAPGEVMLHVDKNQYVIGRSENTADGVLSFNKMIGRAHCKVIKENGAVYIEDLNSANGTYLNRIKLAPQKRCKVENGDIIRLANTELKIVLE